MKPLRYLLVFLFFAIVFAITFTSSNDFTQDLGRHLKLGEIIVNSHQIPRSNLFSYTYSSFPFINHHWLSEVIFYIVTTYTSLDALIILKTVLILLAFAIMVKCSFKKSSLLITCTSALLLSPLILERSDIRPELFGYVFFAYLISILLDEKPNSIMVYSLPIIMILWVNIHITFVFGFVLIGLILGKMLIEKTYKKNPSLLFAIGISFVAPLLNPHGFAGVLYPFQIFGNYGYPIVENQNLFFLNSVTFNPSIKYFFLLTPLYIGSLISLLFYRKYWYFTIFLLFGILTFLQIRHLPFFVLTAIPSISLAMSPLIKKIKITNGGRLLYELSLTIISIILLFFWISNTYYHVFDINKSFGMSIHDDTKNASSFVLQHTLPSPIFNNFDIGGYAIYSLYPKYKVFVDNRPEAYPSTFLQNIYIKLQSDPSLQNKIFKQYNIQTIYFAHTDQTPWAEAFLKRLLNDKSWNIVYLDSTMIVATKAQLNDIRDNEIYLSSLIQKDSNYLHLLRLTRIFALMQKFTLANQAFYKAADLNPQSCSLKRIFYNQQQNTPQFYQAEALKKQFWYCF